MANPSRTHITLACTECKERNYATSKNKRNNPDRVEITKFCPRCNKRTEHKETKKFLDKTFKWYIYHFNKC